MVRRAVGCAGHPLPAGFVHRTPKALSAVSISGVTPPTLPIGEQFIYMMLDLHNVTPDPITIESIELRGTGLGTVLRATRMMLAPFPSRPSSRPDSTPGGLYKVYPPVWKWRGGPCIAQRLVPVRGYALRAGAEARVLIVFQAASLGRFNITGQSCELSVGEWP
jgi:hypothetical protein